MGLAVFIFVVAKRQLKHCFSAGVLLPAHVGVSPPYNSAGYYRLLWRGRALHSNLFSRTHPHAQKDFRFNP
jgi:hypothetical protein